MTLQCVPALDVKLLLRRAPRPPTLTYVLLTYVLAMPDWGAERTWHEIFFELRSIFPKNALNFPKMFRLYFVDLKNPAKLSSNASQVGEGKVGAQKVPFESKLLPAVLLLSRIYFPQITVTVTVLKFG